LAPSAAGASSIFVPKIGWLIFGGDGNFDEVKNHILPIINSRFFYLMHYLINQKIGGKCKKKSLFL
jgi:hypothetical protein